MPEPATTSVMTYISATKLWSIVAGICGSFIPILALADKTKISLRNALFMAITGSSFSIFIGPFVSQKLGLESLQGIIAISWVLGAVGVYVVRAVLNWLDKRGVDIVEGVMNRVIGSGNLPLAKKSNQDIPKNDNTEQRNRNTDIV
jgi:hypothetical protein